MILVLSRDGDEHADAVEAQLRLLDAPVLRFDPGRYPGECELSVRVGAGGRIGAVLRYQGAEIDLTRVDAVWWRRPNRPRALQSLAGTAAGTHIVEEASGLLADLWELLDVPFVPATPLTFQRGAFKVRQLVLAGRLGFEVPGTLVTNDPDAFLDHYEATSGHVIIKRVALIQSMVTADGDVVGRGTRPVRPRDLVEVESVRLAPILTQAMVDKAVEVRATVVGDEVFAAAIHSQQTHHTRVDFRQYDHAHTPITRYALPPEAAERCVTLTRELGLRYGAIDLIVTPEGRIVFLELNPTGQYLWIEQATGLPISLALAELLAGKVTR